MSTLNPSTNPNPVNSYGSGQGPPAGQDTQYSLTLQSILEDSMLLPEFFQSIWQKEARLFSRSRTLQPSHAADGIYDPRRMKEKPMEEMIYQGWHVLADLLEIASTPSRHEGPDGAMVLKDREQIQQLESHAENYGHTLYAPYIDKASIVQNHADLLSPWIADVCQDLQRTFPHVYANTYLTPPNSQAMAPHADDRDVFVIQVVGSKKWQVYQEVPIPYPYANEQVGKQGLPVPQHVLEGPQSIDRKTLQPGDILYIPRGHVHQAECTDDLSFHVTIAIATFDWTLAGMLNSATQSLLMQIPEHRSSILPLIDVKEKAELQEQIDRAFETLKERVTAESMIRNLQARVGNHVKRETPMRERCIQRKLHEQDTTKPTTSIVSSVVGLEASRSVTWETRVRAATENGSPAEPAANFTTRNEVLLRNEARDDFKQLQKQFQENPEFSCSPSEMRNLLKCNPVICDLTLLGWTKRAVEVGLLAIVTD